MSLLPVVLLLFTLLLNDVRLLERKSNLGLSKQGVLPAVPKREDEGGLLGLRGGRAVGQTDLVRSAGPQGQRQGEEGQGPVEGERAEDGGEVQELVLSLHLQLEVNSQRLAEVVLGQEERG